MKNLFTKTTVKNASIIYLRIAQAVILLTTPLYYLVNLTTTGKVMDVALTLLWQLHTLVSPITEISRTAFIPGQAVDVVPLIPEPIFMVIALACVALFILTLEKLIQLIKAWARDELYTSKSVTHLTHIAWILGIAFTVNLLTMLAQEIISALHGVWWYGDTFIRAFDLSYVYQSMPVFTLVLLLIALLLRKNFELNITLKEDADLNI